jgi:selenide,water dikinase
MGPADLHDLLGHLHLAAHEHPDLLVGLARSDDAAVYRLNNGQAIIQTVDFFPPIVDDPYTYGAVAAANAMSDVYAMGGRVLLALNVAGFPQQFPREAMHKIFQGGADKVAEAGAIIAGGHTVVDKEPKYGLCVTGLIHPDRVTVKGGLEPGHRLFLSKPLGTGVITTAAKGERANPAHLEAAIQSMARLNRGAAEVLSAMEVRGCTDVTGFGFLGHGAEMVMASRRGFRIRAEAVPLLSGALDYAGGGFLAGGMGRNRRYVEGLAQEGKLSVRISPGISADLVALLYDSETSGGLLFSAPAERAGEVRERFAAKGEPVWEVGETIPAVAIEII